ncbi:MAG: DUF4245 domain-containing protein [Gordonia sp. (in: high G+C Gram-positive bacteria)]|uniref:DUF4245 domain-containing protein n=1 Tax=Gordonia sp. (in: high G+C Gram-positive bacteria) TaxID=84139 RepID=UPI0039E54D7D
MADAKPRILQDSKDMVWSLIPLLVIALIIAGIAGSCSFGFGHKATEEKIPDFDVKTALVADADTMPFPIRLPAVPADWKANSGSTKEIGAAVASNVGWITGGGAYVQLTQTGASEDELAPSLGGDGTLGDGTKDIDGRRWVAYQNGESHKRVWITDLGDVRLAVVSRGNDQDMTTLAKAAQSAQPLPVHRPDPMGPTPQPTPVPAPTG